ncbi:MAG: DNA methyltransferase [Anaerolineae bacterium]
MNTLYYGDNLDILQRYIKDESVDLIYLDPPFNSNANYNVLFTDKNGSQTASQLQAFKDTWSWPEAAPVYQVLTLEQGPVGAALRAFGDLLPEGGLLAYLVMMAPRLAKLKQVLKPTGSIYLHCDPTASHYLKVLMDAIYKPEQFRNDISWRRTGSHNKTKRYAPIHDTLLFYTKTSNFTWNFIKRPYMRGHVEENFIKDEFGYRTKYYGNVLTGSGVRSGESGKAWHGVDPTPKNRHWAIPGALLDDIDEDITSLTQHEKLDYLSEKGFIIFTPGQYWPIYQRYLKSGDGQCLSDLWAYQPYTEGTVFGTDEGIDADVRWLSPQDQERLGYPTQKPEALLERIINASSNPGDIVLDPFCGCGTATVVAQKLGRQWIGIDISQAAIRTIVQRLHDTFHDCKYNVIGEPTTVEDAQRLAEDDKYQFQWWATGLVGARPAEQKKGADQGIDGKLYFADDNSGKAKLVIVSVKAGHINAGQVRDLVGTVNNEGAAIGVFICMHEPTDPMRSAAAGAGLYQSPLGTHHPRVQILTIAELLAGKGIDYPRQAVNQTFEKAPRERNKGKQGELGIG